MTKNLLTIATLLVPTILGCAAPRLKTESSVRLWEEPLVIPTYQVDPPDPNPRFYAGRAYQGAQGRVYPYPMFDVLTDIRKNCTYNAVYLENEYLKICILPEIGGRVFSALDKTNNYEFLYHQHVIKPALVGMLGAWISGGIEWDLPHHHRASVFVPLDYTLQQNADGSKTIWVGETEIRHRIKWIIGITLYPGKSYFETTVKIFNRTPFAHSFLHWANVAVHANEDYQVIFPPSTEYATYHGKNQFAHWPISHEVYKGVDYTSGVDVSWWKNHPSPVSFFAWNYDDDFLAGYDHGKEAGVVHVANHHVVPGKKFWEWGPGRQGRMWDDILTDNDGPYVELMVGAYSDNQPDYSWLQPYEVKMFKHHWFPIRGLGGVKNANLEAVANLDVTQDGTARIAFNTTSQHKGARVVVTARGEPVFQAEIDIAPNRPFDKEIHVAPEAASDGLRVSLVSWADEELIAVEPVKKPAAPMPDPVKPPPPPSEIKTVEELYLAGLRLEQFYNPALDPYRYYEEGLKRDHDNYRINVALGILYLKRGMFAEAEERLRIALDRAAANYTAPRDGEAYYYLGLVLKFLGRYDCAYDALYAATWSHAFHTAAYYHLAELDCIMGDLPTALQHINRAIATNAWCTKASGLKCALLRRLGRLEEAARLASEVLAVDPLDVWAGYELYLAKAGMGHTREAGAALNALNAKARREAQSYLETAVDYGNCGLWDEAIAVLSILVDCEKGQATTFPMVYYYLGYFFDQNADSKKASEYYRLAGEMPPEYCFPFRLESIAVLRSASHNDPNDARAHYYLGNLLFDHQPGSAIRHWEKSRSLDDSFATVHRNLGIAYTRVENNLPQALASLQKAVACDNADPRLFYELDVAAESSGVSPEKRLQLLQDNHRIVAGRNDALSREIALHIELGHHDEAIELLATHHFRKWEGVGNVHDMYVDAHVLRGRRNLRRGRYLEAVKDFEAALDYPENLEVAKPHDGGRSCQVHYFLGEFYETLGDGEKAGTFYEQSASSKAGGTCSDLSFYRGVALCKLGRDKEGGRVFDALIRCGKERLDAGGAMRFFAKFGEQLGRERRMANAHYLMGLGYLGKGEREEARAQLEKALGLNASNLWARIQLAEME